MKEVGYTVLKYIKEVNVECMKCALFKKRVNGKEVCHGRKGITLCNFFKSKEGAK